MIKRGLLCRGLCDLTERQAVTDREGDTQLPLLLNLAISSNSSKHETFHHRRASILRRGKKSCASYYAFQSPKMGGDPCPYVVGSYPPPQKVHSQLNLACSPLAWQVLLQPLLILRDSRLSLTMGSSSSIWAPWSLISMFCNASGISTFLCSVFSVLHSARHSLLAGIRIR